jgi:DNA topoisomerase I
VCASYLTLFQMGKLNRHILLSNITINIGKGAPVPKCPILGERYHFPRSVVYKLCLQIVACMQCLIICVAYSWKEVKHDNIVTWLPFWNDPVNQKDLKYVFLVTSSSLKGQSAREKYEKFRKLKVVGSVRIYGNFESART